MATTETTAQVYRIFIKAGPEAIWEAITSPERSVDYFHGVRIELRDGRRHTTIPRNGLTWDEAILECDPPRRLVHEWTSAYDPEMALEERSRVTWELEPQDDGTTLLTLTHDRLEGAPKTAAGVEGVGWMGVLSGLKTLLETGEPLR
jgi:uncharacterized protein YndB with AHSA1/START domain